MAHFDLPLAELRDYRSSVPAPTDFDEFWTTTLAEAATIPLDVQARKLDTGLVAVETFDVEYSGFGGHRIKAWLQLPAPALRATLNARLPGVVQFQGYGGGRGLPHENTLWALAGYAHLVMDTRGQGSGWSVGATPDPVGSDSAHTGFMTRGITDPQQYFYRRVFVDAVRAVQVLRDRPDVDESRIAAVGASQGGGLTLAVAGLVPDLAAAMPDVAFLCDFPRAVRLVDTDPYAEIARYLKAHRDRVQQVFATLAYFDGCLLAARATAPSLFSVALMDETCPPSTVFAAYNAYAGEKSIEVYEFNDHEGGREFHQQRQLVWLRGRLGSS